MKVTKSFTLDESVFEDLERLRKFHDRNKSDFVNYTLKGAFKEMDLNLGLGEVKENA